MARSGTTIRPPGARQPSCGSARIPPISCGGTAARAKWRPANPPGWLGSWPPARLPLGMTPSALALSPDGKKLFVACSDGNVAAVVDVSSDRSVVDGFIPTGWYPTAVRVLPSGTLVVLNGKGLRSYPNPGGPNPAKRAAGVHAEPGIRPGYVGYMQTGTASWIEPFTAEQLDVWTAKKTPHSNS